MTFAPVDPSEAIITQINFTRRLENGAGFAVRTDTLEDCYVPKRVAAVARAELGTRYTAKMVPNPVETSRTRTPWMVVYMQDVPPLAVISGVRK